MRLGSGIFLLAAGAILAFGVQDRWSVINLTAIGYILMAAGVLALILAMVTGKQRQTTVHREVLEQHIDQNPTPPVV
jgi:Flp pilus assembly protein TadB